MGQGTRDTGHIQSLHTEMNVTPMNTAAKTTSSLLDLIFLFCISVCFYNSAAKL